MTRKKVKLVWIANDSARKASLKKRRLGLLKKVSELATLCGVEAFMIIYSPDEAEPMIWPPSRSDVDRLIMRYMSIPEMERYKKLMNQESYLKERTGKVHEQSKKSHQKNKDSELGYLMSQVHQGNGLDHFEAVELYGLDWLMMDKMKDLRKRIEYFQMIPPLNEHHGKSEDVDVRGGGGGVLQGKAIQNPNEPLSWDQWFLDMVQDSEANVGGGSGNFSTRGEPEMGFQNSPHGFGPYGLADMGYDQLHGNIGPIGMMMYPPPLELGGDGFGQFPHAQMITGGNPFGLGFPPTTLPPSYHGDNGGRDGGADIGMHGFCGGYGGSGGIGPSALAGGLRPHGNVRSDQIGMPNNEVNNPHLPNNP